MQAGEEEEEHTNKNRSRIRSCCSHNNNNNNNNSSVLSFKPRQVILAAHLKNKPISTTDTNTIKMMNNNNQTLNSDQKSLLFSSVLCYLNSNNSFSKPLKLLISKANIMDDSWKTCSLNLEDMFKHYLETSSIANGTKKEADEAVVKKKKKTSDVTNNISNVAEDVELKTKTKTQKHSASVEETEKVAEDAITESKEKKKKSKRHNSKPVESNVESKDEVDSKDKEKKSEAKADGIDDAKEKTKDKKKKKSKQNPDLTAEKTEKMETGLNSDKKGEKENLIVANEGVKKEKKESKKRKRADSDDNEMGTPLTNGNHEVKGGEFTANKSRRKENNGSAEPKTVTAFQRVKVDEVTFADERLQDNSYWAKDGADVGYGAKAQEVLGQVRGKDFRHEKTKKKRGSYRGGQIDLNSRSVKFNYGDDDEE